MLKGWVTYFAHGNAARCFAYIRIWVEKKVRRHLMRNRKRKGFGWKRWSTSWLHTDLGLFDGYRVSYNQPRQKALPV
jgi:RNA-directed DNA polymerase